MYFYDEKGSQLFEQITHLPEYYLTRTEMHLLESIAKDLTQELKNCDIIEFGSGDCKKISIILDEIPDKYQRNIRYLPMDISESAIQQSATILTQRYPDLTIQGIVADFLTQLSVLPKQRKKILCFLGSTIGNFNIKEATIFLRNVRELMQPEDLLLIGFDLVKDKDIIENAYNDSENITSQFNKNILNVINDILETNFQPDDFIHQAFFNEQYSRVEMHLKATRNLNISCRHHFSDITLQKNETIHTENSYKFTNEHIKSIADKTHLRIQKQYTDKNKWFSVVIFKKPSEDSV